MYVSLLHALHMFPASLKAHDSILVRCLHTYECIWNKICLNQTYHSSIPDSACELEFASFVDVCPVDHKPVALASSIVDGEHLHGENFVWWNALKVENKIIVQHVC